MFVLLLTVALQADPSTAETPSNAMVQAQGLSAPSPRPTNHGELADADGLAPGRFGAYVAGGVPVLTAAVGYGLTDDWGLTLRVDSFYFKTAAVTLSGRRTLRHSGPSTMGIAVHVDVGGTYFDTPEIGDTGQGERWFTGESDLDAGAGLTLSAHSLLGTTLFLDLTALLTGDTETPVSPLTSTPAITFGANGLIHGGLSLPLGRRANLLALLGIDLHFKALSGSNQSLAMPYVALGIEFL